MSKSYYREITFFTNRHRANALGSFRETVVQYFDEFFKRNPDGATLADLRKKINRDMIDAVSFINAAGYSTIVHHLPGAAGGYRRDIDVLVDIFDAVPSSLNGESVLDCIDRAIGIYDNDQKDARIRTFNPFWWLGRLFMLVGRLPFMALAAAGFDTSRLEQSALGKLIRLFVWTAGLTASLITIYSFVAD